MGVIAEYRNAGVGRALKLAQRADALEQGVKLVEWTFDPLQIKNAFFNIERLGAVISRYVLNQYGITSSALQAGLPTDRCIAEWFLDSDRVRSIVGKTAVDRPPIVEKIAAPSDIDQIMKNQPERARDVQAAISEQLSGEHLATRLKRILVADLPSPKQTLEDCFGVGSFLGSRAAADLAGDHGRSDGSLGSVVLRRNIWVFDEGE